MFIVYNLEASFLSFSSATAWDTWEDISVLDTNTSGKESKKVGIKRGFLLKILNFRGLRKVLFKFLGFKEG